MVEMLRVLLEVTYPLVELVHTVSEVMSASDTPAKSATTNRHRLVVRHDVHPRKTHVGKHGLAR